MYFVQIEEDDVHQMQSNEGTVPGSQHIVTEIVRSYVILTTMQILKSFNFHGSVMIKILLQSVRTLDTR